MGLLRHLWEAEKNGFSLKSYFHQPTYDAQADAWPNGAFIGCIASIVSVVICIAATVFIAHKEHVAQQLSQRGIPLSAIVDNVGVSESRRGSEQMTIQFHFTTWDGKHHTGKSWIRTKRPPPIHEGQKISIRYDGENPAINAWDLSLTRTQLEKDEFLVLLAGIQAFAVGSAFLVYRYTRWRRSRALAGPVERA